VDRSGLLEGHVTYRNGAETNHSTILESLGGGVGWFDYDRDGWLDLLAPGGGTLSADQSISGLPAALLRSQQGKAFTAAAASARIQSSELYSHGVSIADYNHDGFGDFLVTGYGRPQLWKNMGDGTFLEVAQLAGITDSTWSSSAGWADLNGDGDLDLYIAHYVNWSFRNHPVCEGSTPSDREICPPRAFEPLPDITYYSQGDGSFADATSIAGLRQDGKGLGVLLGDVEPDGDIDIYVANDTTDNFLYLNDGQGRFQEEGQLRGVALDERGIPNGSMGVDLGDFNDDGRPDLWVANYELEAFALYRNEGRGNFRHVSQRFGVTDLGGLFVGFGTGLEDFDSDGDLDVVVANGHVIKFPVASPRRQLPLMLRNDGKRFQRVDFPAKTYFAEPHEGRGLAMADYDRDGDIDLAISQLNEPLVLLENRFRDQNRSLALNLVGTRSNRDAIGARVEFSSGGKTLYRQVTGGGSYLSHSSRSVHFVLPQDVAGLPTEPQRHGQETGRNDAETGRSRASGTPATLTIYWPSGRVQKLDASSLEGQYTLVEPGEDADTSTVLFASEVSSD